MSLTENNMASMCFFFSLCISFGDVNRMNDPAICVCDVCFVAFFSPSFSLLNITIETTTPPPPFVQASCSSNWWFMCLARFCWLNSMYFNINLSILKSCQTGSVTLRRCFVFFKIPKHLELIILHFFFFFALQNRVNG